MSGGHNKCTDQHGNLTYRASRKREDIERRVYEGEIIVQAELVESNVSREYVYNHELPILMCI